MAENPLVFIEADIPGRELLARELIESIMLGLFEKNKAAEYYNVNPATDKLWVVEIQGSVVAAVALREISGKAQIRELRAMCVASSWRRAGIGSLMLQKLISFAKANQITHFLVKLDRKLTEAVNFFEKNQFTETGQENDKGEFISVLRI